MVSDLLVPCRFLTDVAGKIARAINMPRGTRAERHCISMSFEKSLVCWSFSQN